jgi:hypothetical protein
LKKKEYEEEGETQTPLEDVNKMWDQIKRVIEEANEEVRGGEKKASINRKQEWFDEECKEIINKKNEARRKVLQKETRI